MRNFPSSVKLQLKVGKKNAAVDRLAQAAGVNKPIARAALCLARNPNAYVTAAALLRIISIADALRAIDQ
jgi:hypothetical protein